MHRRGVSSRRFSEARGGAGRPGAIATPFFRDSKSFTLGAFMARISWFDEKTHMPVVDEQAQKLSAFVDAMADGVIDDSELEKQQSSVIEAMKGVEGNLNDEQHAKVTRLLVELSAYNVMRLLHELQGSRLERARTLS